MRQWVHTASEPELQYLGACATQTWQLAVDQCNEVKEIRDGKRQPRMYSPYDFTHSIPQLLSEATIQREQLAAQKAPAKPASGASKSSGKAASGSTQATPFSPTPSKAATNRGTPGTAGTATSSGGRQRGRGSTDGNDIVLLQPASAQQASSSKPGSSTAQHPGLLSPGSSRQVHRDRPLARGGKTRKTLPVKSEHVHGPNGRVLATGQERQVQPAQPTVIPFVKPEDYKELGPVAALDWLRSAAAAPQQVGG
jgi:hypothetical protein